MSKSKQHLYLFFEENEVEFVITSSLVKISMNRFVVSEDAQFEVMGIYNLQKFTKAILDKDDPSYKYLAKERTEKDAFDQALISDAMDKATLHPRVDAHFIIGTDFQFRSARSNLFNWMSQEIENNDIAVRSIRCTVYNGMRCCLVPKEFVVACYKKKLCIERLYKYPEQGVYTTERFLTCFKACFKLHRWYS